MTTTVSARRIFALATASALSFSLAGCGGGGLQDTPSNAEYVAPPSPGKMMPPPKKKRAPKGGGVPLGGGSASFHPAANPSDTRPA